MDDCHTNPEECAASSRIDLTTVRAVYNLTPFQGGLLSLGLRDSYPGIDSHNYFK